MQHAPPPRACRRPASRTPRKPRATPQHTPAPPRRTPGCPHGTAPADVCFKQPDAQRLHRRHDLSRPAAGSAHSWQPCLCPSLRSAWPPRACLGATAPCTHLRSARLSSGPLLDGKVAPARRSLNADRDDRMFGDLHGLKLRVAGAAVARHHAPSLGSKFPRARAA
jgi:hypothetical protein